MVMKQFPVSDDLLQAWYLSLVTAQEALNQVPSQTEDLQCFYPHGESLLEAKAYLNQTVSTLAVELWSRGLPYGSKELS